MEGYSEIGWESGLYVNICVQDNCSNFIDIIAKFGYRQALWIPQIEFANRDRKSEGEDFKKEKSINKFGKKSL